MKKIELKITTPRGLKFEEEADMVVMRCIDGDLGVLPGHEPISTVLGDGILRIHNNGSIKKLALFGGIAQISPTSVNIYSTIAQKPDEIDRERAERDLQDVQATIMEEKEEHQIRRLQVMMRRSLVRIEVSSHVSESPDYDISESDS
ncbi:MAG TPA: ATP synthase F1 subunit epsilon [Firmicutes bacterium]|jgi:F-type H+-transporting ATPase subunit epsilon|nr:ATP synthase F1 subunit epsilon [Bacillota bacterium]